VHYLFHYIVLCMYLVHHHHHNHRVLCVSLVHHHHHHHNHNHRIATCLQQLVISSAKVGWKKQATCVLLDDEPPTPAGIYASDKGWKEIGNITTSQYGGDFLIPMDQILLVTTKGYHSIKKETDRVLSKLKNNRTYMVWYHHLHTPKALAAKARALQDKKRQKT
jgi:hypothetical protein